MLLIFLGQWPVHAIRQNGVPVPDSEEVDAEEPSPEMLEESLTRARLAREAMQSHPSPETEASLSPRKDKESEFLIPGMYTNAGYQVGRWTKMLGINGHWNWKDHVAQLQGLANTKKQQLHSLKGITCSDKFGSFIPELKLSSPDGVAEPSVTYSIKRYAENTFSWSNLDVTMRSPVAEASSQTVSSHVGVFESSAFRWGLSDMLKEKTQEFTVVGKNGPVFSGRKSHKDAWFYIYTTPDPKQDKANAVYDFVLAREQYSAYVKTHYGYRWYLKKDGKNLITFDCSKYVLKGLKGRGLGSCLFSDEAGKSLAIIEHNTGTSEFVLTVNSQNWQDPGLFLTMATLHLSQINFWWALVK